MSPLILWVKYLMHSIHTQFATKTYDLPYIWSYQKFSWPIEINFSYITSSPVIAYQLKNLGPELLVNSHAKIHITQQGFSRLQLIGWYGQSIRCHVRNSLWTNMDFYLIFFINPDLMCVLMHRNVSPVKWGIFVHNHVQTADHQMNKVGASQCYVSCGDQGCVILATFVLPYPWNHW